MTVPRNPFQRNTTPLPKANLGPQACSCGHTVFLNGRWRASGFFPVKFCPQCGDELGYTSDHSWRRPVEHEKFMASLREGE